MSYLFTRRNFIWAIFDDFDTEPRDDFTVKEIKCCNCFINVVQCFIEKNTEIKCRKLYNEIYPVARKLTTADVYLYFSTVTIFWIYWDHLVSRVFANYSQFVFMSKLCHQLF